MSKAVLLSIQPKWCELIASGRKTVEIRKTRPKIETPFKCFIYCILSNNLKNTNNNLWIANYNGYNYLGNGKVIGEFICDNINKFKVFEDGAVQDWNFANLKDSCLTYDEIANYVGEDRYGYAWHISDLKIYDIPKELKCFYRDCGEEPNCDNCIYHYTESNESIGYYDQCCSKIENFKPIGRPPQSWCYVEELVEEVKCKDCKFLMFSDMYGECSLAYKGIVHPDDSCGKGVRKNEESNQNERR